MLPTLRRPIKINKLIKKIKEWGKEKWIDKCSPEMQVTKIMEEVTELHRAILMYDKDNIKEEIGDVFISLVMLDLQRLDFEIEESLNKAKHYIAFPKLLHDDMSVRHHIRSLYTLTADFEQLFVKEFAYKILIDLLYISKKIKFISFEDCVALSYNKISKREGQIINGLFVKEK